MLFMIRSVICSCNRLFSRSIGLGPPLAAFANPSDPHGREGEQTWKI